MSHRATTTDLSTVNVVNALSNSLSLVQTKDIAILLGVPLHVLSDIDSLHTGPVARKAHYIESWLNNDPNYSWEKFTECLKQNGFATIAKNIASQYLHEEQESVSYDVTDTPVQYQVLTSLAVHSSTTLWLRDFVPPARYTKALLAGNSSIAAVRVGTRGGEMWFEKLSVMAENSTFLQEDRQVWADMAENSTFLQNDRQVWADLMRAIFMRNINVVVKLVKDRTELMINFQDRILL